MSNKPEQTRFGNFTRLLIGVAVLAVTGLVVVAGLILSGSGRDDALISDRDWEALVKAGPMPERSVQEQALEQSAVSERSERQKRLTAATSGGRKNKQILFGDTHVHTTFSQDAYSKMAPIYNGFVGAFPPSDACDYARYISQIDFFFLTDHAKAYTPGAWQSAKETVRNCNKVAGDPDNPDLVAFMGYEWTHVGGTAEAHYGHHNVLYKDDDEASLPIRPVAALRFIPGTEQRITPKKLPGIFKLLDFKHRKYYARHAKYIETMQGVPLCPQEIHTKDLPVNCLEYAQDPGELYRKINEFGVEAIVIPHGMAWGNSAPPNASWDHYFDKGLINNNIVRLLEVYSGHGNSEAYRDFTERAFDPAGKVYCPEPQDNFYPSCRRAGDIIERRCLDEGESPTLCTERALQAQQLFVDVPTQLGWLMVPGSNPEEWLDAGQCRDCFLPAFNYRPQKSAQYGLTRRGFDVPGGDDRFIWGFVGSTDTHRSAAGNGFKQQFRLYTTDADGLNGRLREQIAKKRGKPSSIPRVVDQEVALQAGPARRDQERITSFLTLGGLAAVHSAGRDRNAIWEAMKRRETYATSGHRMLLWFDLISETASQPMGSIVETTTTPRFRVSAAGSLKQNPGCPDHIKAVVSGDVLQRLGLGECYNPSDERLKIVRIEVVRLRPQISVDEVVGDLIEDVWKSFPCDDLGDGCRVEFEDSDYPSSRRDTVYYVRAIEEATPTVNGANLRTTFNDANEAVAINPCFGDNRTAVIDDCLSDVEHRAWSSPIFVNYAAEAAE